MVRMAPRLISASGVVLVLLTLPGLRADSKKSAEDQRLELLRGMTAEYATVKTYLPRSKKPLEFNPDGTWDKAQWQETGRDMGVAGRTGDLIQVTHIQIEKDAIILELNHGMKGTGHWYDKVQVGLGGATNPISNSPVTAPAGTNIEIRFSGGIGDLTSAQLKKMLAPVLDFERATPAEQYVDTLPPEIKKAVQEKRAMEGMDRDQVLLALGRPNHKDRETKDGKEVEDWIYGEPPGRITFVTFSGAKVIKVKETYAGLGGSISDTPSQP